MTLFNMIERVKMVYEKEPEENIKRYINDSYKEFCSETRLLRRALGITIVNGENVYPIPPDVITISSVDLYESEDTVPRNVDLAVTDVNDNYVLDTFGNVTYTSPTATEAISVDEPTTKAKWYVLNDNLVINYYDGVNESVPDGTFSVAVINYSRLPEYMDSYTDEPLIEQRWHDAIVAKTIALVALKTKTTRVDRNGSAYEAVGDYQAHQYWKSLYDKAVFDGKKIGNKRHSETMPTIQANYF